MTHPNRHFVLARRLACALGLSLSLGATLGCSERESKEEAAATEAAAELPPLEFVVDQPGTLYTWVDAEGRFHLSEKLIEVPADRRHAVRIVTEGKPTGSASHVFVADLSTATPGASLRATPKPRVEWEALGLAYKQAKVTPLEDKQASELAQAAPPATAGQAIVYGAEWCGPCHQAEAYLKKKGLQVVKKDIEEDDGAAREMRAKLKAAGLSGSSIPVLDVAGTVLIGFSERAIDATLKKAK